MFEGTNPVGTSGLRYPSRSGESRHHRTVGGRARPQTIETAPARPGHVDTGPVVRVQGASRAGRGRPLQGRRGVGGEEGRQGLLGTGGSRQTADNGLGP